MLSFFMYWLDWVINSISLRFWIPAPEVLEQFWEDQCLYDVVLAEGNTSVREEFEAYIDW